jgi:hypothetical protein
VQATQERQTGRSLPFIERLVVFKHLSIADTAKVRRFF